MAVEKGPRESGPLALAVAADTRRWAKARAMHIIHCLLDTSSAPFATANDAAHLPHAIFILQTPAGDEAAVLRENAAAEPTLTRRVSYVSALKSPGLLAYLKEQGITNLVLAGLNTSGCVLRTAFAACDAEFVVTVLRDACADPQMDVHETLVRKVLPHRGYVFSASEFREGWVEGTLGR